MPFAGVVVVPADKALEKTLCSRLNALDGASVKGIGDKGIALVLEAESVVSLESVSKTISRWEEVVDFQLAYLNWEEGGDAR